MVKVVKLHMVQNSLVAKIHTCMYHASFAHFLEMGEFYPYVKIYKNPLGEFCTIRNLTTFTARESFVPM